MPKDTPKMAGTMMKTSSRVHHTVNEMPRRMHSKLSKGLKNSTILKTGRLGYLATSTEYKLANSRRGTVARFLAEWPESLLPEQGLH